MWWTLQRWSAQPVFQPKSEETRRRQGSGVITFMRRRPPPLVRWYSGMPGMWIVQCSD